MTRAQQLRAWIADIATWLRRVEELRREFTFFPVPPMPPQFVWDELRLRAAALDGNEACRVAAEERRDPTSFAHEAVRSTSGLADQPPAPIDQLDAHDSAATQAAVALLRGVVTGLEVHVMNFSLQPKVATAMQKERDHVRRALELLGVKP